MKNSPARQAWLYTEDPGQPLEFLGNAAAPFTQLPLTDDVASAKADDRVFFRRLRPDGALFAMGRFDGRSESISESKLRVNLDLMLKSGLPDEIIKEKLPKSPHFRSEISGPSIHRIDPALARDLERMLLEAAKSETAGSGNVDPSKSTHAEKHVERLAVNQASSSTQEDALNRESAAPPPISMPWNARVSPSSQLVLKIAAYYANNKVENPDRLTATCLFIALVDLVEVRKQFYNTPAEYIARLFVSKDRKRFDQFANKYLSNRLDPWLDHLPEPIRQVHLSDHLEAGFAQAAAFARQTSGALPEPEHLVAGILKVPGPLHDRLVRISLQPDDLRQELTKILTDSFPDRKSEWRTLFYRSEPADETPPAIEPVNHIAVIDADLAEDTRDALQVQRYVDAFARVIASQTLDPPLSIGLFGDWGSGKTSFMHMLEQKVNALAGQARKDGTLPYHPHICQIRFNAWHYAEVNLWASLVSTIFHELQRYLDGPDNEKQEFEKLIKQLEIGIQLHKEALEEEKKAGDEHQEAQKQLSAAETELASIEPPWPGSAKYDALLKQELQHVLGDDIARFKNAGQTIERLGNFLGRDDLAQQGKKLSGQTLFEDASTVIQGVHAMTRRADFWWRALAASKLGRSPVFWMVLVFTIALPIFAVSKSTDTTQKMLSGFGSLLMDALVLCGSTLAWIKKIMAMTGQWFGHIDQLQAEIERKVEEARFTDRSSHEAEVETARQREASARRKLEAAQQKVHETGRALAEAQANRRNSTSQARLARFIRDRAAKADYAKHLGIIATVHNDFDKLSIMLKGSNSDKTEDGNLPTLNRIVLYIDDLDRCPAKVVVRVLEAVHLMLAFPLFVVVVGVDSRWVSRALNKHYNDMLYDEAVIQPLQTGSETRPRMAGRPPAQSQDYLEKIFQVPFWLRRMEPNAVKRLIESLIPETQIDRTWNQAPSLQHGQEQQANQDFNANQIDRSHKENEPDLELKEDEIKVKQKQIEHKKMIKLVEEAEGSAQKRDNGVAAPTESLKITGKERDYMDEVAPLMPRSPRSVKRFVNIYRIYKAALSEKGLARFLGSRNAPGNFRAVQVLLALVIGTPPLARAVYDELEENGSGRRLSDLVVNLRQAKEDHDQESVLWNTTLKALGYFTLNEKNNLTLEELRQVAPLVGRYSVHHMLSDEPGFCEQLG